MSLSLIEINRLNDGGTLELEIAHFFGNLQDDIPGKTFARLKLEYDGHARLIVLGLPASLIQIGVAFTG